MGRWITARLLQFLALATLALTAPAKAQNAGQADARTLLEQAAEAMGGLERLQGLETVTYTGFGQRAYYQGGGNVVGDPMAPMKWQALADVRRTMVFAEQGTNGQERWGQMFPFAGTFGLDYRLRRGIQDHLDHPLSALRSALEGNWQLAVGEPEDGFQMVRFGHSSYPGEHAIIALDPDTHLPRFVRRVQSHANLGDLTFTTWFSGYLPFDGIQLPMGILQKLDWRDTTNLMLQIDSYRFDERDAVRPAPILPLDRQPAPETQVTPLAAGVWDVRVEGAGGAVVEFSDRLVMFEAYGSEAETLMRIDAANALVPGKRVEAVIVSHHHFDHTGGLRAAVSRGLEIISHRGNEGILREMVERPAVIFPDALADNPQPLRFTPVDERLVLEDATKRLEVYRVIEHSHMANAVFAYLPVERIMMEGDLGDEAWNYHFWASALAANIAHYGIDPERNVAVHGTGARSIELTLADNQRQAEAAMALCEEYEAVGRFQPGCPVQYDSGGPLPLTAR